MRGVPAGRRMKTIATIGYESDTQGAVIQKLKDADVKVLIDVRAVAASRRAGFSKSLLAASLAEAGIEYVHLRDLGTPKAGRDAARAGRVDEMRHIFEEHLEEPAAQVQMARALAQRGGLTPEQAFQVLQQHQFNFDAAVQFVSNQRGAPI